MKKRLFMLALTATLVLSFGASALAVSGGYNIASFTAAYETIYSLDVKMGYLSSIVLNTGLEKYPDGTEETYTLSADTLKWTVTNTDGALIRCRLVDADDEDTVKTEVDISGLADTGSTPKSYRIRLMGNIAKAGTVKVKASLEGSSIDKTSGDSEKEVTITFIDAYADSDDNMYYSDETGEGASDDDIKDSYIVYDPDTYDPRDPDSKEYNGIDPLILNSINTANYDYTGVSPTLGKIDNKLLAFTAGTSVDLDIPIIGPVEKVDVYITAKDAVNLGWIAKGKEKETAPIRLTRENIKKYRIPFRVVDYSFVKSVDRGTDAKKVDKTLKANWKKATNTITLQFNGGNFEYKAFPITIGMHNKTTDGKNKPVAKSLKLSITPNNTLPIWGILDKYPQHIGGTTGGRHTYYYSNSTSNYNTWLDWQSNYPVGTTRTSTFGDTTTTVYYNQYNYETAATTYKYVPLKDNSGKSLAVQYYTDGGKLQRYELDDAQAKSIYGNIDYSSQLGDDYSPWLLSEYFEQRAKYWYAGIPTIFYQRQIITTESPEKTTPIKYVIIQDFKSFDKKSQPTIEATLYLNEDKSTDGGEFDDRTYTVMAPAPYQIPDIKKLKEEGIQVSIIQPSFDYLGRNTVSGSVTIDGKVSKKGKTAVTFTASNPSTKKKTTLKVTIAATLIKPSDYLSFTNTKEFNFDTSILDPTNTSDAWFRDSDSRRSYYDYDLDGGYSAKREKLAMKKVTMPKLPKAAFKAKGLKPITYRLGLYDENGYPDQYAAFYLARARFDGVPELWDYMYGYIITHSKYYEYAEAFNRDIESNLEAIGLSFDVKKGTIILKEKRGKTSPTLDDNYEYFKSLDIAVTAINKLGSKRAWAEIAITGEKPKVVDKSVAIKGKVQKGDVFRFKLMAGKAAAESVTDGSANVRSYIADDASAKVLSDWGLELVNYDAMDIIVSDEVSFASCDIIPAYDSSRTKILEGTIEESADASGDITYYASSKDEYLRLASGDKWVRSKNASYKNYGLIQVIDSAKLAKVIADAAAADKKGKALKKLESGSKINLMLDNLGLSQKGSIKVTLAKDITNGGDPVYIANHSKASRTSTAVNNKASVNRTGGYAGRVPENFRTEDEAAEVEAVLTFGSPRTAADLSSAQRAYLAKNGYKVIAVLPELSANVDGQQDIDVELDDNAPTGEKMIYIPFPKNVQQVDDDSIVDFYDAAGTPIDVVPAKKAIVAAPWLRSGVTYEPVIAVEQ